jgi:hypothetical protein
MDRRTREYRMEEKLALAGDKSQENDEKNFRNNWHSENNY